MQGKKIEADVRSQALLWGVAVVAAVVLAVNNSIALFVATIVVGVVWDRLDLTLGENTLPSRFLSVTLCLAAGAGLAVATAFVTRSPAGDFAVVASVWDIVDAYPDGGLDGALYIARDIALFALAFPLRALLVTAILAFGQKALTDLMGRPLLPYGAGVLLVLWALPAMVMGGGAATLVLSLLFGGFYIFARRNSVISYFVVLLCLLACG